MRKDNDQESKLVLLRKEREITQKQIAEALGVTERTVWAWEKGHQIPRLTIAQTKALCRLLGVALEDMPDNLGPVAS